MGNSDATATVKVHDPDKSGDFIIIALADFKKEVHELWDDAKAEVDKLEGKTTLPVSKKTTTDANGNAPAGPQTSGDGANQTGGTADGTNNGPTGPDFSKMTVEQMKVFAAQNNIDLGVSTSKADITKTMEAWKATNFPAVQGTGTNGINDPARQ